MLRPSNDKFNLDLLAQRLEARKERDASGKIVFKGFESNDILTVLATSLELPDIPSADRGNLVRRACFQLGTRATLTGRSLRTEIGRLVREYRAQPLQSFMLLTSLAVSNRTLLPPIRVDGATITFTRTIPRVFDLADLKEELELLDSPLPPDYTVARIRVTGRTATQAADSALFALSFICGLWNYALTRNLISWHAGRWQPINQVRLGPYHTIHGSRGEAVGDRFWFEESWRPQWTAKNLESRWPMVKRTEQRLRQLIRKHPEGHVLKQAFVRYARALDIADRETAFVRLWSLLEYLTDTTKARYEETIRRVTFLCNDVALHRQVLEHLRDIRNAAVHRAEFEGESETSLLQVKRYVEQLLVYHLRWPWKSSFQEACSMLDHSTDIASLKRRRRDLGRALSFRRA